MSPGQLASLFEVMDRILLPRPVSRYISRLVAGTHPGATETTAQVNSYVSYGASPRAAIAIAEAARASAMLDARPTVGFEDARRVASAVLNHRIILNYKARFDEVDSFAVIDELLMQLDPAGMNLPKDISMEQAPT